uniref:HTH_48 domain-containing protein n=1 Tax=Meloidogyne hapla TaxID=6305 RepID=A0A1I8B900_MELHA
MSISHSDNNLTTLNSIDSLNATTDDSTNDCSIIEESVEKEVHKLLMDILQNKIFDDSTLASPTQKEIENILRNQFKLCVLNASEAARNINRMFGKNVVAERKAKKLFKKFRVGRYKMNHELLEKKFKENPKMSAAELASGICSVLAARRWMCKKEREKKKGIDRQVASNLNKEKKIRIEGHTEDEERADGKHSICQIDPVTKKRFYEPHRRPGCDDIYCLSSVTQIGERICNIENKMIELEELFCELVKKNTSDNNKIPNSQYQQSSSLFSQRQFLQNYNREQQNIRQFAPTNTFNGTRAILGSSICNILPIQGRNEQIYRPNTSIATSSQAQQRIIAPKTFVRPPVRQMLPVASATATISATRPLSGYPVPRQLNIIRPNENSRFKPVDIPHKELKNGVRVCKFLISFLNFFNLDFVDITQSSQNTCPVCFGIFSGIIFTDRSGSIIQNIHLKRHTSGPLEAFYCQICSHCVTQPRVLFLSLPSIVQEALQHFIANQLKLSITQLITEMNSAKNSNWVPTMPVGQFTKTFSNSPTNIKNKSTKKVDNSKNNQQNKKKKRRGREETPPFDLDGDPLDHLLKCPNQCTLIQRHRTLKKRKQILPKQLLEPLKMQSFVIDQSLLGLAKYIDYKNDNRQNKNYKQIGKEVEEGRSNPITLDDNEGETNESENDEDEDEEISSNDSDYAPNKANKGWETRKRKKMGSNERSSSTNIVDQLQQHRLQQILSKNLNNSPSSSQSLPVQKPWMNITLNSSLSSNGVQNVLCKTEPANQKQ